MRDEANELLYGMLTLRLFLLLSNKSRNKLVTLVGVGEHPPDPVLGRSGRLKAKQAIAPNSHFSVI